jgi:hypothetical protein
MQETKREQEKAEDKPREAMRRPVPDLVAPRRRMSGFRHSLFQACMIKESCKHGKLWLIYTQRDPY